MIQQQKYETANRINTTQLEIATHPYATQTFGTFDEMVRWLNDPLTAQLWKIGRINWVENTVRIEGRSQLKC